MNLIKIMMSSLILFGCPITQCGWFAHDRAVCAGQKGDWKSAQKLFTSALIHQPDDPQLLYDAGVAAYKLGEFAQANAYFSAAAQSEKAPDALRELAYFNAGNACVALEQLEQAIKEYEAALTISPDNERTRHNLELVKKMLEQKKQEQEKKKKQEEKQKNKEEQKERDKGEQENKGSNEQSDAEQPEKEPGEQQEGNDGNEKKEERGAGEKKKGEQEKQQGEQQRKPGEQKEQQNEPKQANADQKQQQSDQQGSRLEPKLAQLLEDQEKRDAQLNKQLMKAAIGSKGAPNYGNNCW